MDYKVVLVDSIGVISRYLDSFKGSLNIIYSGVATLCYYGDKRCGLHNYPIVIYNIKNKSLIITSLNKDDLLSYFDKYYINYVEVCLNQSVLDDLDEAPEFILLSDKARICKHLKRLMRKNDEVTIYPDVYGHIDIVYETNRAQLIYIEKRNFSIIVEFTKCLLLLNLSSSEEKKMVEYISELFKNNNIPYRISGNVSYEITPKKLK